MLAPYRSLHAVIDQHPLFWPLRRFSRYRFPTEDYLRELNGTRVVVLHGDQDTVIPVSHSRAMHQALKSEIDLCYIELEGGNHFNMLSGDYAARMLNALSVC